MKTVIPVIAFIFCGFAAKCQQNYFIYIQTENKQPFYVKANDKLMSSSASGYIVVPKLLPGSYTITVGFPKDQWPQQTFPLVVANADAGYLLKDFGTKGWGLFNIQTMEVAMAGTSAAEKTDKGGDDLFTNALSGAANTNLKTEPVPVKAEPAVTNAAPVVKPDTPVKTSANTGIERISSAEDSIGKTMVYVDRSSVSLDTIHIFVPENSQTGIAQKDSRLKQGMKKVDAGMKEMADDLKNYIVPKKDQKTAAYTNNDKPVVSFNSDCRVIATADDFLKIRRRMTVETGDEAMIDAARKFFKLKCYSTEQIKNLSTLFLSDSGKYGFFDAAYAHVNDTHNFSSLQSQLHDEYYINRFNAMLRN